MCPGFTVGSADVSAAGAGLTARSTGSAAACSAGADTAGRSVAGAAAGVSAGRTRGISPLSPLLVVSLVLVSALGDVCSGAVAPAAFASVDAGGEASVMRSVWPSAASAGFSAIVGALAAADGRGFAAAWRAFAPWAPRYQQRRLLFARSTR